MQNKMISFAFVLLASVACVAVPALAQEAEKTAPAETPAVVSVPETSQPEQDDLKAKQAAAVERAKAAREKAQQARLGKKADSAVGQPTPVKEPVKEPIAETQPKAEITAEAVKTEGAVEADPIKEENKRRLEEELNNTNVSGKTIVDFPNRPSLGSLELTPLPGLNEVAIGGPLPMGQSVSGKDLPSEQLLGRITPEVFQEMADLERGNTFLKLQLEKEKLKNDLEQLKATYRQKRLDEIAKREDVVRSRIQWWQEQEKLRVALEKKQQEEAELARKIAEQEAERDRVREETMKRMAGAKQVKNAQGKVEQVEKETILPPTMEELYTIESIRGIGQNLSAKLRSKTDGMELTVKRDDILPSGHVVQEVKRDSLTVAYGNRMDQLIFRPNQQ